MFNNAEIKGNEMEPGTYQVNIFNAEVKSFNDKDYLSVQFKCEAGSHFENFYMTEKALWRLKELSILCGIGKNDSWEPADLIGKPLTIELVIEIYDNKERLKVKKMAVPRIDNTENDPF